MLNVRLAGDNLYGKLLFTWLSLVMSLMVSFCAVLFAHEMSWMISGTKLGQFLRVVLPTLTDEVDKNYVMKLCRRTFLGPVILMKPFFTLSPEMTKLNSTAAARITVLMPKRLSLHLSNLSKYFFL